MFKGYVRTFPIDEGARNGEVGNAQFTRHPLLIGQVFIENRQELRGVLKRTLQLRRAAVAASKCGLGDNPFTSCERVSSTRSGSSSTDARTVPLRK